MAQGRDIGRPAVRAPGRTTTATATPCCSSSSRRARAPATPASTPASSGPSGDSARAARSSRPWPASTPSSPSGASCWPTSSPRWRPSPVSSATARLPARVGRARRALEPLVVRRPRTRWPRSSPGAATSRSGRHAPPDVPTRPGHPRRRRARCWAPYRAPPLDDLPPLHGGLMGYLGYDVVREVERLPDVPRRRPGPPRRHAVGHRRAGRLRPLAPAGHPRSPTCSSPGLDVDDAGSTRSTTTPSRGSTTGPATAPARSTSRWSSRPDPDEPLPEVPLGAWAAERVPAGGRGGQGAHPRRRHLPGRAGAALRPRPRRRPVRRLPGAAPGQPEPVHVLRAPARR